MTTDGSAFFSNTYNYPWPLQIFACPRTPSFQLRYEGTTGLWTVKALNVEVTNELLTFSHLSATLWAAICINTSEVAKSIATVGCNCIRSKTSTKRLVLLLSLGLFIATNCNLKTFWWGKTFNYVTYWSAQPIEEENNPSNWIALH